MAHRELWELPGRLSRRPGKTRELVYLQVGMESAR
jgi:hypothetical protein